MTREISRLLKTIGFELARDAVYGILGSILGDRDRDLSIEQMRLISEITDRVRDIRLGADE